MSDASQVAIKLLRRHREELSTVLNSKTFQQANEKIGRWYARVRKDIDSHVSNEEAHAFGKFVQRRMVDPYEYTELSLLEDVIQYYQDKIDVLVEELEKHPETVLDPSKLAVQKAVPPAHPLRLIHKDIIAVSIKRFDAGEYADAVLGAFKAVNNRVKAHYRDKTGEELDGTPLMQKSMNNDQIIKIGDLSTQSGKDMQEGYRFIFAGSMLAIRNPKAHDEIKIDQSRAVHFLFLASLEMHKLDEAGVKPHQAGSDREP